MHFLLFTVGTDGDLNPYLGLGTALRERGNRVTLMTNPDKEILVKSLGLEFVAVGDPNDLESYVNHPDYFNATKGWKLVLESCFLGPMRQTYAVISKYAKSGPTTVVSAAWGFGARIAHEKLGVPLATIHLEPHNVRSLHQTGVMPPPLILHDWVPKISKRIQFWIADRWFVDPRLSPKVNAFRRELGLPPVKRITFEWWNSPQRIIGMYPEWLVPPQPDWPPQLELVGFPLWDRASAVKPANGAVEFAKQNRPIVFTAGSNNSHASRFFKTALECCDTMKRKGIFVSKEPIEIPTHLADDVRQFRYVGFGGLLPYASALVHHGGAGTAARAPAAGTPQLVLPTVHGTRDIAARLKRIGVAETLKPASFSAANANRSLGRLMNSTRVKERCRIYQDKMKSGASAISRTCDLVARLPASKAGNEK